MGRAPSGSTGHKIRRDGYDSYTLSWSTRHKVFGSRLLFWRTFQRETDKKGAERFAKKWNVEMPPEPVRAP